jgi:hypothetical protein
MALSALSLDIKSTKNLFKRFSSSRATMLRGRHGIGKSQVVYQIAGELRHDFYLDRGNCERASAALAKDSGFVKMLASFWKRNDTNPAYADIPRNVWHYDMGIPCVERRLSQMTEGDITGIPFEGNRGGTVFRACEWLLATCEFPCVLFLDELNRAIKGVEQATFQLADSKAFDGNLLHEGTRVMVAVNVGDQYDVTPMDPAALSRYAVVDLDPTTQDWLDWAGNNCNQAMVEFIRSNERYLEYKDTCEPNKKYPDRRAWGNLDSELCQAGLYEDFNNVLFCHMAASMVGFEAANSFWKFVRERGTEISAEEVLSNWKNAKSRLPTDEVTRHVKYIDIMGKLDHKLKNHVMTDSEAKELAAYMHDCPAEVMMGAWKAVNMQQSNAFKVHPHIEALLLRVFTQPTPAAAPAASTAADPAAAGTPATKAVKARTRKR